MQIFSVDKREREKREREREKERDAFYGSGSADLNRFRLHSKSVYYASTPQNGKNCGSERDFAMVRERDCTKFKKKKTTELDTLDGRN